MNSLKSSYELISSLSSIYTGGTVRVSGDRLYTNYSDSITVSGKDSRKVGTVDEDSISCFAVTQDYLVICYASCSVKIYSTTDGYTLLRTFKAFQAPVLSMDIDVTGSLVALGSADSTIRVYDIAQGYCTHQFKGHSGVVSCLKFHPQKWILFSGSDDTNVRVWDLEKKSCLATLDSHVSVIRDFTFSLDGGQLISAARDQVFCIWDIDSLSLSKTVPVYESLEAIVQVNGFYVTGGQKGALKLWNEEGDCLGTFGQNETKHEIIQILYDSVQNLVIAVTSDQNIMYYNISTVSNESVPSFTLAKQIAGYNEQILDLALVGSSIDDQRLAVITNTEQIRLYDLETKNCSIVYGHGDIILAADASSDKRMLVTGSKDDTARIWRYKENGQLDLVATCSGHTEAVSTVAFSRRTNTFVLTGSQDRTIKLWNLDTSNESVKAKYTIHAHEKDIQSIAIAPNDKVFASAALDKTAKLWSMEDGSLLGTFKGHKRGIWKVIFHPVDQVLATCSTDKTIKIWNLRDFSCIRTFEGHLNSVLNICFVSAGLQILSAGSDGLVKLWNVKEGECVANFDEHQDRIWAMMTMTRPSSDNVDEVEELLITGSADSNVHIWKDVTAQEVAEKQQQEDAKLLKEQDLHLYIARKDYRSAVSLALELNQPYRLLGVLNEVRRECHDVNSLTGSSSLDSFITSLDKDSLAQILSYIRDWNTHSKHVSVAQSLLYLILHFTPQDRLFSVPDFRNLVDGLLVYSERHLSHATESLKSSYFLEYSLTEMNRLTM